MTAPIHVYPTNGPEHVIEGTDCWREPEVIPATPESAAVIIHNEVH